MATKLFGFRVRKDKKKKLKSRRKKPVLLFFLVVVILASTYGVWYYWRTATANETFEYSLCPVVILEGQRVSPDDFLYSAENMEEIIVTFTNPDVDLSAGRRDIPLTLACNKRIVETTATLCVLAPVENVRIEFAAEGPEFEPLDFIANAEAAAGLPFIANAEAAAGLPFTANDKAAAGRPSAANDKAAAGRPFTANDEEAATGLPFSIEFSVEPKRPEEYPVGSFPIDLTLNGIAFEVMLYVEDTTPPYAKAVNLTIPMGEEVTTDEFVTDIYDVSPISSIEFAAKPDVFAPGDQTVEIAIADDFGNCEVFEATLTVLPNEIPPVIEGVHTIESMIGKPIMYRQGVSAFDAFGRPLDFEVDSSDVDQNKKGIYTVTYWVEDVCGLRTEITVTVDIVDIDPQWVDDKVDGILAKILKEGMTQVEQTRAIHNWIRSNMRYAATVGPQSVYEGAYRALQDRQGSCYVFYSISEVMLTRAGVPNMRIERIPGQSTKHRWNLINPDGLGWYHFDATPTRLSNINRLMYMFTDSQADDFAKQLLISNGIPNFYKYVPELYPEIMQ